MNEEIEQCFWYETSRNQRKEEVARGLGETGTHGYESIGCYKCDGKDYECAGYDIMEEANVRR